jgi:exodeoxyribonuclease-3
MKIASWNVNSIRARIDHVTAWIKLQQPDVLLLQELKATEFPALVFQALGYESVAVTQKSYNGVAVLSRHPMETINTTLAGDEADSHARYLELTIEGIRIVNIYLPNGNPVGTEKFAYKLAWMDRLLEKMSAWRKEDVPVLVGGDFNVIPEDIDCHKPSSWIRDALFQPEPRSRYRALLDLGYTDAFRFLASWRDRAIHLLGLFSPGVRTQSRHSHRSFSAFVQASRSAAKLRDRPGPTSAGKAV